MPTLSACPACRTAVPPGGPTCLRCGHAVDLPLRPCPACQQPASADDRFCARCGATLDAALPAATGTTSAVDVADVFPEPPSYRRPFLIGVSAVGVLILALTLVDVIEWRFFRPQATITGYFVALADRDGARASRLLASSDQEILDMTALRSDDYTPPTDVRVDTVETEDDTATARVGFTLGGQRQEMTMSLVRDQDRAAGLFPRWRIVDGTYQVNVYVVGVPSVVLAGVTVPITEAGEAATAHVFPGDYVARLPKHPLLVAEPVTVRAGVQRGAGGGAEMVPSVSPGAREQAERQVRQHVDDCAAKTVLDPDGCPFSTYSYGDARDVHWKIITYPSVSVELDSYRTGMIVVRTVQPGVAKATWREVYVSTAYPEDYEDSFTVSGTVVASGDAVTFTASTDY